ncbi:hypothetical protein HOF92_10510 [bacterium]|jgi:hypothetical protein|nr:hypothetical protein [bacterium]
MRKRTLLYLFLFLLVSSFLSSHAQRLGLKPSTRQVRENPGHEYMFKMQGEKYGYLKVIVYSLRARRKHSPKFLDIVLQNKNSRELIEKRIELFEVKPAPRSSYLKNTNPAGRVERYSFISKVPLVEGDYTVDLLIGKKESKWRKKTNPISVGIEQDRITLLTHFWLDQDDKFKMGVPYTDYFYDSVKKELSKEEESIINKPFYLKQKLASYQLPVRMDRGGSRGLVWTFILKARLVSDQTATEGNVIYTQRPFFNEKNEVENWSTIYFGFSSPTALAQCYRFEFEGYDDEGRRSNPFNNNGQILSSNQFCPRSTQFDKNSYLSGVYNKESNKWTLEYVNP